MDIWAHRLRLEPGDVGNSEKGLIALYNLGIQHIETDVISIPGGKKIIYHPKSTCPDLSKMSWQEIERSIFKVLGLDTFLNSLKCYQGMSCCLEIKQNSEQLVEEVVSAIIARKLQDRIFLTAFHKKIDLPFLHTESGGKLLLHAKKLNPEIKTHLISAWPANLPKLVNEYHPDMLSFGWLQEPIITSLVSRGLFNTSALIADLRKKVEEVKKTGVTVMAGIVNDIESMRYLAELGVDGIMTDDATLGMTFKHELEAANG